MRIQPLHGLRPRRSTLRLAEPGSHLGLHVFPPMDATGGDVIKTLLDGRAKFGVVVEIFSHGLLDRRHERLLPRFGDCLEARLLLVGKGDDHAVRHDGSLPANMPYSCFVLKRLSRVAAIGYGTE